MNVLWLTSPFNKDDISTNKDTVWVYTDNLEKKGGGETLEWMRRNDNCHALITRESIGDKGYFREDNTIRTTRIIRDSFHGLQLKIRQGKLIILPSIEINEALLELEKNSPILALIFSGCIKKINQYRMTTLV